MKQGQDFAVPLLQVLAKVGEVEDTETTFTDLTEKFGKRVSNRSEKGSDPFFSQRRYPGRHRLRRRLFRRPHIRQC